MLHYQRMRDGRDLSEPIRQVIREGSDQERLRAKVVIDAVTGCWNWTASKTPLGYGQFRFRGTCELAHRVSWILFRGEIPPTTGHYGTMGVLHKCDNPSCVNPDHLFLGDQTANAVDAVTKGRWGKRGCKGEAHGRSELTETEVREILASSDSLSALASRYGVSRGTISHIRKRRTWRHLE